MSFFTNLRADKLITEIRSSTDSGSPATQKAIARLKDLGAGAIEPVFGALPDADKNATVAFVEVLGGLAGLDLTDAEPAPAPPPDPPGAPPGRPR